LNALLTTILNQEEEIKKLKKELEAGAKKVTSKKSQKAATA